MNPFLKSQNYDKNNPLIGIRKKRWNSMVTQP